MVPSYSEQEPWVRNPNSAYLKNNAFFSKLRSNKAWVHVFFLKKLHFTAVLQLEISVTEMVSLSPIAGTHLLDYTLDYLTEKTLSRILSKIYLRK